MIKPRALPKNATIGLVSPSAPIAGIFPHRLEQCIKALTDLGYKVVLGKHAAGWRGYVSGSVEERLSDIHEMFERSDVANWRTAL